MSEQDPLQGQPEAPGLDQELEFEVQSNEDQDQGAAEAESQAQENSDRLDELDERIMELAQRDTWENPFPARLNSDGTFQELLVINGSLSDFTAGRANGTNNAYIPMNGSASNNALIVELEDSDDNGQPRTAWVAINPGPPVPPPLFAVTVTVAGGDAGSGTTPCTLTYTVYSLAGAVLGDNVAPIMQRPALGLTVAATIGLGLYDGNVFKLWWCDEVPARVKRVC